MLVGRRYMGSAPGRSTRDVRWSDGMAATDVVVRKEQGTAYEGKGVGNLVLPEECEQ